MLLFAFFFMDLVLAAGAAEFFNFQLFRVLAPQVAVGLVIKILALRAL